MCQALNFNWVELMALAHHPFQGIAFFFWFFFFLVPIRFYMSVLDKQVHTKKEGIWQPTGQEVCSFGSWWCNKTRGPLLCQPRSRWLPSITLELNQCHLKGSNATVFKPVLKPQCGPNPWAHRFNVIIFSFVHPGARQRIGPEIVRAATRDAEREALGATR